MGALLAQVVGHAVVDAHQLVHLLLAGLAEARLEIAVVQELGPGAQHCQGAEEAAHQHQSAAQGEHEGRLHRQQPEAIAPQQHHRQAGEGQVQAEEVEQEPPPEAQASIPYFSKRR